MGEDLGTAMWAITVLPENGVLGMVLRLEGDVRRVLGLRLAFLGGRTT